MKALVSEMQRQIEESRAVNSQVSLERDEALARNACLTQIVNKSHKQRAGGGRKDLIDSSSLGTQGSPLISQFVKLCLAQGR